MKYFKIEEYIFFLLSELVIIAIDRNDPNKKVIFTIVILGEAFLSIRFRNYIYCGNILKIMFSRAGGGLW